MGACKQHTVKSSVAFSGVGIHTGEPCRAVVKPAPAGSGVSFKRCDIDGADSLISASPLNVVLSHHGTVLGNADGTRVATVEHLMAALALGSIDNALIEVDGPEIPILDGSAVQFLRAFKETGLTTQSQPRNVIAIDKALVVNDGGRSVRIEPHDSFALDIVIDFEDCLIGRQQLNMVFEDFDDERLASSRTFCRLYEVELLRRMGMIRGGSLENSIVVDGDRILNEDALRDPQEFVLHKALDLIGDLYLLGAPIRGKVLAEKPGHDLNTSLALAIAEGEALSNRSEESRPLAATA